MIDGIRFKVCGITSHVDAEFADRCGADCLGFILYPKSPRRIRLETFRAMADRLPERRKVAVSVEPTVAELAAMQEAGFDYFQIHFRQQETPESQLTAWSRLVGEKRLWLAPKLPPSVDVSPAVRAVAKFILLDTFHADGFGGSGRTGDWGKFARHQAAHPGNVWILAGGLNPDNIGDALRQSAARFVDVNSGVEAAPGVKDHVKLKRFIVALHEAAVAARAGRGRNSYPMRFHPPFFLLLGFLSGCATPPVKNYTFATAPRVIDYPAYVYRAGTEKAFVSSPADGHEAGASAVVGRQLVFPVVLFRVPPRYPIAMKVRGIGGEVLVEFTVQPDGSVADAHPVKATDDAFVAPAIACIRQWRFKPGTVDGRLVHWARVQQAITFFLD